MRKNTTITLSPEAVAFCEEHFRTVRGGILHILKVMPAILGDARQRFLAAMAEADPKELTQALATEPTAPGEAEWARVRRVAARVLPERPLARLEALPGADLEIVALDAVLNVHGHWPGAAPEGERLQVYLPVDLRRYYQEMFGPRQESRGWAVLVETFARWANLYRQSQHFQGRAVRQFWAAGDVEAVISAALQGRGPIPELPPGALLNETLGQWQKEVSEEQFAAVFRPVGEGRSATWFRTEVATLPWSFLAVMELTGRCAGRAVVVSPKVHGPALDGLTRLFGSNRHAGATLACEGFFTLALQEEGESLSGLTSLEVVFIREALAREGRDLDGRLLGRPLIARLERFCQINAGATAQKMLQSSLFERLERKTPMQLALLEIHCRKKNRRQEAA